MVWMKRAKMEKGKKNRNLSSGLACSPRRTRTTDRVVNSHLLYRLSYQGMFKEHIECTSLFTFSQLLIAKKIRFIFRSGSDCLFPLVELVDDISDFCKVFIQFSLCLCLCYNTEIRLCVGLSHIEPPGWELYSVTVEVKNLIWIHV